MAILKFCLIVIAVTIFQGVGSRYVRSLMYFDVALVVVFYYAEQGNRVYSLAIGSIVGLMQDAISGLPLGINGFGKTAIAYMITTLSKRIALDSKLTQSGVLLLSSFVNAAIIFAFFTMIEWKISPDFVRHAVVQALVTSILGVLTLNFLTRKF